MMRETMVGRMRSMLLAVGALSLFAPGCSGPEECTTIDVTVSVFGPSGQSVADAIVELNNEPCTVNGDGTYTCTALYESADQHLVALHPAFSSVGQFIELPEACDTPYAVTMTLGVMMGA